MEWSAAHTTTVFPSKPIREHWLPLSNLDRVVIPTYAKVLLAYSTGGMNKRGYREVLETLKYSLARVLVDFYPMAGRLGVQEHGLVSLHCNSAGAIFTEAFVDQNLEDLDVTRHMSALSGLEAAQLGPGTLFIPSGDMQIPVLIVQATHFKCESIVLAVNWHHTVADMYSGCHFLKSWAELASGNTQPSLRPVHSRHLVSARNELDVNLAEQWSHVAILGIGGPHLPPDPLTEIRTLGFGSHAAESIKQEANRDGEEDPAVQCELGRNVTTMECLLAYLWRLLARARRADEPQDEDNVSRFFVFVEGRKYLNLPAGYFGNVVACACAMSTQESLMNGTLSYSAGLLQSAVAMVSCREFFQSLIDWVEVQRLSSIRHEQRLSSEHYVAAVLWTFLPLEELDFGMGKPLVAFTSPAPRRLFDSFVILPGLHPDDDYSGLLNIRATCLSQLQADAEFNSMCKSHQPIAKSTRTSISCGNGLEDVT